MTSDAKDMRDLLVPTLGESIAEAVIGRWLVAVGDHVKADDPVVELETDKIALELPAPASGVLVEQLANVGDTVEPGAIVGRMDAGAEAGAAKPAATAEKPERETQEPDLRVAPSAAPEPIPSTRPAIDESALRRATPAMRRAMRLGHVQPDIEPRGRETRAPHEEARDETREPPPAQADEVVPMSPLRKRIAERLVQAQHESASLTTFNEADMSAVMELRKQHNDEFVKRHGVKLGFMSFFAKACVAACQRFPGLNAEIRGDAIVYKQRYDFGVAVSTERGLVVPVLRGVDRLGFADIERAIIDMAEKARNGKLTLDDLSGGTFTITNGGIFGSMLSTPLLNYPQTGILGMHNIVQRPVAVGGQIAIRPIMYIALTYDHRVVDGREAVQFLIAVKQRIESPDRLMFDL